MADFDLTQTDQQVQNILNDAQGAMGASAQTTLTTEYVMLKDTSGVYHKILKSSFTEAIRDVLAGLLVNNDKGTTINQIAAIASGDFGSITPNNLASVLGALMGIKRKVVTMTQGETTDTGLSSNGIFVFMANGSSSCSVVAIRNTLMNVLVDGAEFKTTDDATIYKIISDNGKVFIKTIASTSSFAWKAEIVQIVAR